MKAFSPSATLKYLIVPVIETLSGIIFAAVPPLIVARPNVTVSFESILLTHAEDRDIRTLAAPNRGLIERSGLEPWPPLPMMFIFIRAAPAILGPGSTLTVPVFIKEVKCIPHIASIFFLESTVSILSIPQPISSPSSKQKIIVPLR